MSKKEYKLQKSKFAEESANENTVANTTLALFNSGTDVDESKFERRNMPPMIKPGDVPVGAAISGEIVAVLESPVSTVKGYLLHLRHQTGQEFTFPCTGVIRQALAPGKKEGDELVKALEKEIGKILFAKRLPDKMSAKYKKPMFVFDVYTGKK